jgi:hypothetical protein
MRPDDETIERVSDWQTSFVLVLLAVMIMSTLGTRVGKRRA